MKVKLNKISSNVCERTSPKTITRFFVSDEVGRTLTILNEDEAKEVIRKLKDAFELYKKLESVKCAELTVEIR